mgnify:CR=1 FL=1
MLLPRAAQWHISAGRLPYLRTAQLIIMFLNMKTILATALIGSLFFFSASTACAHELKNNTARVELRDNHFRIQLNVAVLDWLTQVGPHREGKRPSFDETQIETKLGQAKQALLTDTRLWADEVQAKLKVLHFPKPEDIRELLIQFAEVQKRRAKLPHGFGWWNIQLEGVFHGEPPSTVSVAFPESLGELSINFTQPSYRQVVPGAKTTFQTLQSAPSNGETTHQLPWILVAMLALGLLGQRLLGSSKSSEI